MLDFEFANIMVTEFGVGHDYESGPAFCTVPVDGDVKDALLEMARMTWDSLQKQPDGPIPYDPAEKHGSTEYLYVPANDDLGDAIRQLYDAKNLPMDGGSLSDPSTILCYFARFVNDVGQSLTALRRATQFKGVLKSRLVQLVTDSLSIIEDQVFKLDQEYDILMDSLNTHILRPSSFEFLASLKQQILAAVPTNIEKISQDLEFLEFSGIRDYASTHSRAARYLASIRTQNLAGITRDSLVNSCKSTGVKIEVRNGSVVVPEQQIMGFLEVLDRRRYWIELVPDIPEQFVATGRRRVSP